MKNALFNFAAVAAVICAAGAMGYGVSQSLGSPDTTSSTETAAPRLVTVDIVRIMNAERAVASKIIGSHNSTAVTKLTHAGKQLKTTIRHVAGPATVVLVKQAIVASNGTTIPDITDSVLDKLGLPTDVASVGLDNDLARATRFGNSDTYNKLKNHFNKQLSLDKQWRSQARAGATDQLVP